MANTTPAPWPPLPTPEGIITDTDHWVYAAPSAPEAYGSCGLRVFHASDRGYIAIVTEHHPTHTPPAGQRPYGLWITTGAPDIWRALVTEYGVPLTVLEHHPGQRDSAEHFDQYGPAADWSDTVTDRRRPVSYITDAHPDYDDVRTWWDAHRAYLTAHTRTAPKNQEIST